MVLKLLFLFISLILNTALFGQTRGVVSDSLLGEPISDVHIKMNGQNIKYYDGYEILNLRLSYHQKISDRIALNLTAMADNLPDRSFASMIRVNAPSFGGADPRWYYPGAPRSFRFGFELNYNLNIL